MLHSEHTEPLIKYFEIVLQVLQHHQVTVKLKKCRFFPQSAEFVGMDVEAEGNRPARSKMQALEDLKSKPPNTLTDLRQIIGLIGFYQDWLANYELRIGRWRQHIKTLKGTQPTESEIKMDSVWTAEDTKLLNDLLDELASRPTLARPNYTRRFYLKTDWCRLGMAAVLLQAEPESTEAAEAERQETQKEAPCSFDKHMHRLRLRPIAFSSRKCGESEGNMHSYTGEAATGVWAIEKYKRHLFGREFTWMTDCNGLRQFFEGDDVPTHMHQRMRQRLLRFLFTIVHRPARFMVECDVLTRYNNLTSQWRIKDNNGVAASTTEATRIAIAITNQPVAETPNTRQARTLLAAKTDTTRVIWNMNAGATNITTAITTTGINAHIRHIEDRPEWMKHPFDKTEDDPDMISTEQLERTIEPNETVDWIVVQDGDTGDSEEEEEQQFRRISTLVRLGEQHNLRAILIFTRPERGRSCSEKQTNVHRRIDELEHGGWQTLRATVKANRYGAAVARKFTMIIAMRSIETLRAFHMQRAQATPLADFICDRAEPRNPNIQTEPELQAMQRPQHKDGSETQSNDEPKVAAMVQRKGQQTNQKEWITAWTPCFSIDHPGPYLQDESILWYESPFAIETTDVQTHTSVVRGIRQHELVEILGYDDNSKYRILQQAPEIAMTQIRTTPPPQLWAAAMDGIHQAETKTQGAEQKTDTDDTPATPNDDEGIDKDLRNALSIMLAQEFQQTTTIPLPTIAQWQDATSKDWDLHRITQALRNQEPLQRDEIQSAELYKLWQQGKIEEDNGILYHNGVGNTTRPCRHVRTRIAPPRLRQAIFSALHVAPMAGHTGFQKTFWKIAARYYWPNMATEIKELTLGCGHCKAANVASHEAQQQLQTFEADEPFDVITLDVWHPGRAATVKKGNGSHAVTCIDAMTGFATAAFVEALDSETMTRVAFTAFFITHGLPKLVIIDSGSEFAGAMQTLCGNIGLPNYTVSKENHKAIICERFHRYLNKVQRIHAADCETFQDFMLGTIFAVYAWNSAPVDGTNIVRSYAAIGREFPFPIDYEREAIIPRDHQAQGQQTLEHIDSTFPLWRRQQAIIKILIEDRREYHRQLKNEGRNMKTFAPGDLVVVKKQVQTTQEKGPAKARMQARGPYRIIEQIKPGTYKLQRLPGVQGAGRRGRTTKESAARLTRIPSTLVVHKPTAGIDTRLATYRHAIVDNPLENILGLHEPGRYRQADPQQPFAYDKIEDMWQEDIDNNWAALIEGEDSSDDSSDDSSEEGDDGGHHGGGGEAYNDNNGNNQTRDEQSGNNQPDVDETENNNGNEPEENIETRTQPEQAARKDAVAGRTTATAIPNKTANVRKHNKRKQAPQSNNAANNTSGNQRASGRNTKIPARYREEETETGQKPPQAKKHKSNQENTARTQRAHKLYKQIRKSRDKMFFIKYIIDTTNVSRWYVVQVMVSDDDGEATRNEGKYTVRFYIREHANSKERQLRNCRYWPEVHQLRPNGMLGPIVPIRPGRVDTILQQQPQKYKAYDQTVNLLDNALVGPFDFAVPKHYQQESNRIAFEEWEDLKTAAAEHDLDVTDIEEIVPLQ